MTDTEIKEVTHTPGPWEWPDHFGLVGSDDKSVLEIGLGYDGLWGGEPASDADRSLIAAAPDLLVALKAMVLCFTSSDGSISPEPTDRGEWLNSMVAAREAIAKAEHPKNSC